MTDSTRRSEEEHVWHARLEDMDVFVRALYPTSDEKLPGWTVLKNWDGKPVLLVRDDAALYIERTDAVVPRSAAETTA